MDWLVTGSGGQLGRALRAELASRAGHRLVAAPDHAALDLADRASLRRYFDALATAPTVVVNAAAFTHVDRCEPESELAMRVNGEAPGELAAICRERGARFVQISTDYVFSGDAKEAYREDTATGPRSAYGRSKLLGEERVRSADPSALILRTSWVFGQGRNFIVAIVNQLAARRRGEAQGPLRVVADQRGRPTYAVDLARGIADLVQRGATGTLHLANDGECSWWELARFVCDEAGAKSQEIQAIATSELTLPAARPAYSVLDLARAARAGVKLRPWQDAVRAYLAAPFTPLAALRAAAAGGRS
jgi:dTDP-4-dehydrorhamnose reductase